MTFGAFISARRKDLKLNLRETAKHLKIAYGYLSDIEQSRRPAPDGDFVDRISAFLQLDKKEHPPAIPQPYLVSDEVELS